ncbi:hypothetical protein IG631_23750 [Alternaria alternata]|nr:hypothetical protein IG631_23750 [Alternaria alternata]
MHGVAVEIGGMRGAGQDGTACKGPVGTRVRLYGRMCPAQCGLMRCALLSWSQATVTAIFALNNPATMCEPVKIADSSPAQGSLHVSFDKFQEASTEVLRSVAVRLFNPHRRL